MSGILRIIILMSGLSISWFVLMLLIRKKINEKNTLVWLIGVFAVILLSVNPNFLDTVAAWVGVDYPPSLLFLCAFIVLLIIALYQSVQISQLYDKLKEISQFVALQEKKQQSAAERQERQSSEKS
ncbi:DUF2304 domain-containing protein [Paenibacillus thermotolerans]|uniref:DUF2304 domain-containing protein n=1 Tax=Paenibacillus thermotolerans TaxID=3027807 RepID=UPI0023689E14|nr:MULTISPECIES: DUF2304 domain-containing protein [unclassified Paenibacillus]